MQSKTEEGNNNQGGASVQSCRMSSVRVVGEGSNQVGEGKNKVVDDSVRKGEKSNSCISGENSTASSSKGGEKTFCRFRLQRLLGKVCK